jgi:integrase
VYSTGILKGVFGSSCLEEIDSLAVERLKVGRLKEGVSKARVNRNLALLKKMFNLAIDWGYAKENPVRRVKLFSEKDNLKERILTEEEEKSLLEAASAHLKPIVKTALHTGMRRGEILGLEWDQVDLGKRMIRVTRTKSGKSRFIPINDLLFEELEILKKTNGLSKNVFLNPEGKGPLADVKTAFKAASRRAGIKGLRFHDLRHTFASRLVERGVDIITVKDLLGHHSVVTTQRYTHSNADQKRKAVQNLVPNVQIPPEFVPAVSTEKKEQASIDLFTAN